MKKITVILVFLLLSASAAFAQRKEGFTQYFEVPFGETVELLTVPANKTLVLRKLYLSGVSIWQINRDGELLLSNIIGLSPFDFPDYSVTVGPGGTLGASGMNGLGKMILMGYFYTPGASGADLNGDGVVDFLDFAIFGSKWLDSV